VAPTVSQRLVTVALVGNPNAGKTTLFNALSGLRHRVGNYPGVTVELKKGRARHAGREFELIDLPGTYSLAPRSPDEMVAVDLLLGRQAGEPRPDVIVSVVDASNLDRHLYLTTQALDLGVPLVVALNMIDVAEGQGLKIDAERLSKELGVPVVPIRANRKVGLDRLKQAVATAALEKEGQRTEDRGQTEGLLPVLCPLSSVPLFRGPTFPAAFTAEEEALARVLGEDVPPFLVRRLLLDIGGHTERRLAERGGPAVAELVQAARKRLQEAGCGVPAVEARTRYGWIKHATAAAVQRPARRPVSWTDRLDHVLTHKVWGTLLFLALMFGVFQAIFTGAKPLMKGLSDGKDALADLLRGALPPGPLTSLLCDGLLDGVGAVVVFIPQIVILFGFIAVLEDCGYMARAAFLMDKLMARCGLNGKSFIPLLSSVACAVPGILATRVIENRRDRLATILVAPLMSCSARLPVYTLLIAAFIPTDTVLGGWLPGLTLFGLYLIGVVVAPLVALILKRTLLRGATPVFVMEMPIYQLPSARVVLRRMADSGWAFVRRAGTLILASMVLVWVLLYFPNTDPEGRPYEERIAALTSQVKGAEGETKEQLQKEADELAGEWKRQSVLGRAGRALEPAFRPLGWDWKVGTAALASFPAREVVVGTLGLLYNQGKVEADEVREGGEGGQSLIAAVQKDWGGDARLKPYVLSTALSLMVFFALCCQCASTLAVIRRETNSWRWPAFTFAYMTALAYVGALVTFQVGAWLTDRLG
jgi:ferrous iron transport protein B